MERYCVLDEELYLNAEIYQWEVKETEPPFGIFMQMLHQYYDPIPITEQLRLLNGVDHVTCYWNGKKQQNTKHSNEPAENYTKDDANKLETFPKHIKEQSLIQKQPSKSEGCFCIYVRKA